MNNKRQTLTPAQRQHRRRSRLPKRIDYYPSTEALDLINIIQENICHKSNGYRSKESTYSAVIDSMILK